MGTPWCSSGGVAALAQWLREAGIGTDAYGVGSAKSLAQLVEEVDRGETVLARQGGGRGAAIRCVRVASVFITSATGQVLIEERQVTFRVPTRWVPTACPSPLRWARSPRAPTRPRAFIGRAVRRVRRAARAKL
jgi:hypothetical protein